MSDTELIEANFGSNGGVRHFRTFDDIERFVEAERQAWSWLFSIDARDPGNAQGRVEGRLNEIRNHIANWRNQKTRLRDAVDNLRNYFSSTGEGLLVHDGELGERILLIKERIGLRPAALAYSFTRNWVQLGNVDSLDYLSAIVLLAVPALADASGLEARLNAERNNYRSSLRRQLESAVSAEKLRAEQWISLQAEGQRRITYWVARQAVRWRRLRRSETAQSREAVESIRAVEAAYNEYMRLKAPADYWRIKADAHKTAEGSARGALLAFFPIAAILVASAFAGVAALLLYSTREVETPVYFVLSAGLGIFGGLVFWVGRILTRLYLSEHHLRKDAEERAVMTTTYLALTKDAAAEANDRQIILAALFRNSSDGIVKDDGAESSVVGMLARLGMPRP